MLNANGLTLFLGKLHGLRCAVAQHVISKLACFDQRGLVSLLGSPVNGSGASGSLASVEMREEGNPRRLWLSYAHLRQGKAKKEPGAGEDAGDAFGKLTPA